MSAKATLGQMLRYGVVGLTSNALLYLAYLALTSMGVEPKLAMSLLYALGVIQTFYFNKAWSFRHGGTHGPAFIRYCISYGLGYLFNLAALYVLVDHLGHPHQIIQGALIICTAVLLFLLQKLWVFRSDIPSPNATTPSL
ncbi:MAG: GtrA family protein [Zoogloea sp.]|uniref:GtrA family protein n=1 Tax=Zoogloea sp. TaxID=49181 RepID=UPI002635A0DB|nr:GtrA family protein [Zoogloea sp.]MDD2988983.1 GtrA family protein [Zoogloea sp.]